MRKRLILGMAFIVGLGIQTAWARAQVSDAQTLAKIQDKVFHTNVFAHGQVTATYDHGVATLEGTVDNLGSRLDAERAASKVEGVTRVIDNIQVRVDDFTPQQMLEAARKQVVTYYAYGIFDNIQLEAQGDKLIVSGQVTEPFKKSDLGNFLKRVKGVATLENSLDVLPVSYNDDLLRVQVARAIYGSSSLFNYGNRPVPPIHIIVKNGNVTLEGAVGSKMDRQLAESAARSAGLSFSVTNNLRVG
ncbi:MAG: BON domain-containing protein [Acidobacteria bacterium]|nr:BON domain-containing protein [Acidobacteriota bacterium]